MYFCLQVFIGNDKLVATFLVVISPKVPKSALDSHCTSKTPGIHSRFYDLSQKQVGVLHSVNT